MLDQLSPQKNLLQSQTESKKSLDFSFSRKEAKALLLPTYSKGRICKLNHIPVLRYTNDGACVLCSKVKQQSPAYKAKAVIRRKENAEDMREYFSEYHKKKYAEIKSDPVLWEQQQEKARQKLARLKENPEKYEASIQRKRDYRKTVEARERSKERYERLQADDEYRKARIAYGVEYQRKPERKIKSKILRQERRLKNPSAAKAKDAAYRALKLQRTPPWANPDLTREVYDKIEKMREDSGIDYEADHRVPLQGKNVSGLHVHYNIEPLQANLNRTKSNRFTEQDAEEYGVWKGADYYINGWN